MSLFYWKSCSITIYQIFAFLMSLLWGKVWVVYCSYICWRLNTFKLYILQIGCEVLWHVILWTGTIYNRCWNFSLCLKAWMNSVKHEVISELPRNLSSARAKVSSRPGDLKWQRPLDEKDAQSWQWGRKKKSSHGAGQRTGSLREEWDHWMSWCKSHFCSDTCLYSSSLQLSSFNKWVAFKTQEHNQPLRNIIAETQFTVYLSVFCSCLSH